MHNQANQLQIQRLLLKQAVGLNLTKHVIRNQMNSNIHNTILDSD